ncbi:MAG: hypothetical protein WD971_00745 [Pirellulales bacterium]
MSTSYSQPDTPDTDELVAYLDGELTADECRRVERRLAGDAEYRRRLTELEQAWSALEALPPTAVGDDFARTTIEMVAVVAERDAKDQSATQSASGRRRTYRMAAAGLAIALAAFVAARAFAPSRNHALVADLPVIAQLDVLTEVGDVEYLRGLATLNLEPNARGATNVANVSAAANWQTFDDRLKWIDVLPVDQKAELAAKFDRFEKLGPAPAAQDRLRKLQLDVAASQHREQLEATLAAYAVWLQSRSPGDKLELRELPTADRLLRVKRMLEESKRAARRKLSLEDEQALQDAILSIVEERRGELVQEVRRQGHPDPERRIAGRSVAQVALVIVMRDMQDDKRRRQLQDRLTARLSPEAQDYLDGLEGGQRMRQLWRWMYDALEPKFGSQSLEQFFAAELTNDQREYLLGLPLAEMEVQLQQMYMRSQVGLRDDDFPRRFWRGGPGGRGPEERGRGRDERGRRDGPGRDFERDGFDGPPPFPPGPGGRGGPGGPPPREGRDWRPPPREFGPPNGGPRREDGPPPDGPPPDEPN